MQEIHGISWVILWAAARIALAWLAADFITGIIHWWEDDYGNPTWPIIGKFVVQPNLDHHRKPRLLLEGSYWNRINTSVYAVLLVGVVVWFLGCHSWSVMLCLVFCSQGNQVHAISHRSDKENGTFIVFLQCLGILQTRKTHGWHHKAPYDTNFCVMTEFLNPVLNSIKFWNKLEKVVYIVFRVNVLRGSSLRGGI